MAVRTILWREDPARAERLSLLAGLVPTQWSTLWFGGVFPDTDKCLCDGGKTMQLLLEAPGFTDRRRSRTRKDLEK